jgi:hypothetical protein
LWGTGTGGGDEQQQEARQPAQQPPPVQPHQQQVMPPPQAGNPEAQTDKPRPTVFFYPGIGGNNKELPGAPYQARQYNPDAINAYVQSVNGNLVMVNSPAEYQQYLKDHPEIAGNPKIGVGFSGGVPQLLASHRNAPFNETVSIGATNPNSYGQEAFRGSRHTNYPMHNMRDTIGGGQQPIVQKASYSPQPQGSGFLGQMAAGPKVRMTGFHYIWKAYRSRSS